MNKAKVCKQYFDRAAVDLANNPGLASYLVGLAHAWRIVGAIDMETCRGMEQAAKALHRADGRSA